jgi:hypothetical protein
VSPAAAAIVLHTSENHEQQQTLGVQQQTITGHVAALDELTQRAANAVVALGGTMQQPAADTTGPRAGGSGPMEVTQQALPPPAPLPPSSTMSPLDELSKMHKACERALDTLSNADILPSYPNLQQASAWQGKLLHCYDRTRARDGQATVPEDIFVREVIVRGWVGHEMAQAAHRAIQGGKLKTLASFFTWVREWFGMTGDAVRDQAFADLRDGKLRQRDKETVIAYHSRFQNLLAKAGDDTLSTAYTLQLFHKGMLPEVYSECVTDPMGNVWSDMAALVAYANGRQLALRAAAMARQEARARQQAGTPHYARHGKPGFKHPHMRHGYEQGTAQVAASGGTSQILTGAFRPAPARGGRGGGSGGRGGRGGGGRGQGGPGGSGRGGGPGGPGGGGRGRGSGGPGGGGGGRSDMPKRFIVYESTPIKEDRTHQQMQTCHDQGRCFRCLKDLTVWDANHLNRGKYWECRNAWIAWPDSIRLSEWPVVQH